MRDDPSILAGGVMNMGVLNRLDSVDQSALGLSARRWKRGLRAPEQSAALAVWPELSEVERDTAREAAVWARVVEGHPRVALVTADFQAQMISQTIRAQVWVSVWSFGAASVLAVVGIATGQLNVILPALPPLVMLPAIVSVQLRRSDRARQRNLGVAEGAVLPRARRE